MEEKQFKGGNSRLLAKQLDRLANPLAVLDRRGNIVFANTALCRLANSDAVSLVGKRCSWQIPPDNEPLGPILAALAPPASVLQGQATIRQLNSPIVFGAPEDGQLFLPLHDDEQALDSCLVVLGPWSQIREQLPQASENREPPRGQDSLLVALRSRWKRLDGLLALIGESPAVQLAMKRVQLAIEDTCSLWLSGPRGCELQDIVQAVFMARLERAGLPSASGHLFPIDAAVVDRTLLGRMLEVFTARLHSASSASARMLLIQHVDQLTSENLEELLTWLREYGHCCTLACTGNIAAFELAARGDAWSSLVSLGATIEAVLPPLRERRQDIPALVQHLVAAECHGADRAQLRIAAETMDLLVAYPWPEDVKQVKSAIRSAVKHAVLTKVIHPDHLPAAIRAFPQSIEAAGVRRVQPIDLDSVLADLERVILKRAIRLSPRNRAQVARWLGISRPRLLRRIQQLGIEKE